MFNNPTSVWVGWGLKNLNTSWNRVNLFFRTDVVSNEVDDMKTQLAEKERDMDVRLSNICSLEKKITYVLGNGKKISVG